MKPVRLQLSRRKGFDLQAASMATNGLPAVNVARPSKWGNPFSWIDWMDTARALPELPFSADKKAWAKEQAVAEFRELMQPQPSNVVRIYMGMDGIARELRGKNLACWCHRGEYCHADVLLELANRPICEVVA